MIEFHRKPSIAKTIVFFLGGFFLLFSAACREQPTQNTGDIYIPPTPRITNTPIPVVTETQVSQTGATPTPTCTNVLIFLSDITIPDGSVVSPGEKLDKQWQLQNNGSCNWDSSYQVRLIAGPEMGVDSDQALYPARSGIEFPFRMVFTAPDEPGAYRSAWQAYDSSGTAFGDPFFIDIVVLEIPEEGGGS